MSRMTADYGPFPAPEVIEEWAQARRAGRTMAQIAAADDIPVTVVSRATRSHGPFTPIGPRLPDGVVGLKGLAQMVGVTEPTVVRWVRQDRTPAPDFITASGRRLWLPATLTRWLSDANLATCPDCRARCISLSHHRRIAHRP
ncbi:hypothetical protein [Phycicoccus flavus]|uniref:hypothetical protein n=1 Tax=Phycicoccus flavus TaxID=2502783 RepID=UPI000FEBFEB8|nr:hypothetical protein [Phycicoccus flavus]